MHRNEDETFYLLEGSMTFYSGSSKFTAGAGTTVFLPRNAPHGFRADTPGRVLILTTPAGFDSFVAEAGKPATSLVIPPPKEPDFARLTALAAPRREAARSVLPTNGSQGRALRQAVFLRPARPRR